MRMTSAPLTKVPLRGTGTNPGSLVMVPVEMGPIVAMAPGEIWAGPVYF